MSAKVCRNDIIHCSSPSWRHVMARLVFADGTKALSRSVIHCPSCKSFMYKGSETYGQMVQLKQTGENNFEVPGPKEPDTDALDELEIRVEGASGTWLPRNARGGATPMSRLNGSYRMNGKYNGKPVYHNTTTNAVMFFWSGMDCWVMNFAGSFTDYAARSDRDLSDSVWPPEDLGWRLDHIAGEWGDAELVVSLDNPGKMSVPLPQLHIPVWKKPDTSGYGSAQAADAKAAAKTGTLEATKLHLGGVYDKWEMVSVTNNKFAERGWASVNPESGSACVWPSSQRDGPPILSFDSMAEFLSAGWRIDLGADGHPLPHKRGY
mmetsp:Transcript_65532/g.153337  ORF Transcript_65532/g.153337 Transcript_65532/m.153337 type:complete len:321 (+) Transcript_65532:60-1022(+)|eukprot:s1885_g1.t1